MADHSHIEWTDATWNWITGCSLASPGCTHCYAMQLAGTRLAHHPSRSGLTREVNGHHVWTGEVRRNEKWLTQPLQWKKPRRIFVCAHGDLFHESVPDEWIDQAFAVMALAPQHTFQVLTKRSDRMRGYLSNYGTQERIAIWAMRLAPVGRNIADAGLIFAPNQRRTYCIERWPLRNVWLGVSCEDQKRADDRIPDLLATPAAVRWVSAEPLLGPIDLDRLGNIQNLRSALPELVAYHEQDVRPNTISGMQISALGGAGQATTFYQTPDHMGGFAIRFPRPFPRLDWIVVGGESGINGRPMHPRWARDIRDQCAADGVAFHFKQWGEWAPAPDSPTGSYEAFRARGARDLFVWNDGSGVASEMVGKMRAGRLLDGREHNEFPRGASA